MKMNRGLLLTVTVAIGSFIQGWVFLLLVGYPSYLKEELNLENEPELDSIVWYMSSIGVLLAALSGRRGGIGHRPLLIISSMIYLFCSTVMSLSRDPTLIKVSWFLDVSAWGFSYIIMPFYFLETAPPKGFLRHLLPHFTNLFGACLCFICLMLPSWRLIFDVAFTLSLLYFVLVVFFLPESPKWLVRNGRIDEARHILQMLRGNNDVSDEMYSLLYSVRLEGATSVEDLNIDDLEYGPRDVSSDNLSKPVTLSTAYQQGGIESQNAATLLDSLLNHSGDVCAGEDSLTGEGDDSHV